MCGTIINLGAQFTPATFISSRVVERGEYFDVVETVREVTNKTGQQILQTNRYTHLGNGLNYQDNYGNWVESKPVVQAYPDGILCKGASYSVILGTNLNSVGAVDLLANDNRRIVSSPIGLGFYDPVSGKSVLLARIRNCQPELLSSNEVAYANAFDGDGIEASVIYTYGIGHFHQDVIFTKQLSKTPADYGLSDQTRLEIMTEFYELPLTTNKFQILKRETNAMLRAQMKEPDLVDESLSAGHMRMPLRNAYLTGKESKQHRRVPVAKKLLTTPDGRTMLVEAVQWKSVEADLDQLPQPSAKLKGPFQNASTTREFPRGVARASTETFSKHLAQVERSRPIELAENNQRLTSGTTFVLDYEWVQSGLSNFHFTSGTYYCSGEVDLFGASQFNGDPDPVVIKLYPGGGELDVYDYIEQANTGQIVLTSSEDDSVGQIITDDTDPHVPELGSIYMILQNSSDYQTIMPDMDIRYSALAIATDNQDINLGSDGTHDTCTLRHVYTGVEIWGSDLNVTIDHLYYCDAVDNAVADEGSGNSITIGDTGSADCDGDYDNDGLPDAWEMQKFGNLNQTGSGDYDGDGLSNLQEYQLGTDPTKVDTDGDGIPDDWEVLMGTNPLIDDNAQPSSRANYGYTLADWLNNVSGIRSGSVNLDNEGNVLSVSQ